MTSIVAMESLKFRWPTGQRNVLEIPHFNIESGEKVFLKGPSGSGKTSLLSLIGGINAPSEGSIRVLGQDIGDYSQAQKDKFRADHIGFIFQQFNLLPYLSVIENIALSCKFSDSRKRKVLNKQASIDKEARRLLELLHFPVELIDVSVSDLSVGQQQRVAVARALIGSPEIVIADEPSSALDAETRGRFISLLLNECDEAKASILFVSHDSMLEQYFDRTIDLTQLNLAQTGLGV